MKFGRAGILTKIVALALIIYMTTSLFDLRGRIRSTELERDSLKASVEQLTLDNQKKTEAIERSDDPATIEQAARDEGFVKEGETLFIDIAG